MKASEALFWFVWIMSIIFLLVSIPIYGMSVFIPLIILFFLTGMAMYSQTSYRKKFQSLGIMIKNIDFRPLEKELSKIEESQEEWMSKISNLEKKLDGLDSYKLEQEMKYRDLVRKILEVDNKLNRKYKKLGESIIELNKKVKKT